MKRVVRTGLVVLIMSILVMSNHVSEASDSYKRKYPNRHISKRHSKATITKHGRVVKFVNGQFYQQGRHAFYEVKPPVGTTVHFIPNDHQIKMSNGIVYKYKNIHYRKMKYGNGFVVVRPPAKSLVGH